MNIVGWRCFKIILPLGLFFALLTGLMFGNYALSFASPDWLQIFAREIQAACRDAGTQWMVLVCLVSYFTVFVVLKAKSNVSGLRSKVARESSASGLKSKVASESEVSGLTSEVEEADTLTSPRPSPLPAGAERGKSFARLMHFCGQSSDAWLVAFVGLVLLRYAFDYANAARSLQVVVLLTGIVLGKGVALWAAWQSAPGLKSKVQGPRSAEVGRGSPLPAELASDPSGAHGVTRPTINSQPSYINRERAILSLLVFLLAGASQWHPERGMEFFYRGQPRWTGPWDNPNLYGVLMGVGLTLALGLLVSRLMSNGQSREAKSESREPDRTLGAKCSTINTHPTTSNFLRRCVAHITRHTPQFLLVVAAGLCAYGWLKSYSRGAWLGTAVGIGYFIWKWLKQTHLTPALSPRPTGGEGESASRHEDSQLETVRELSTFNFQPSTRRLWLPLFIFLVSLLTISFWQFRHTESPLLRRVFSVGNVNDFSWRNRVTAWQGAGRMMLHKPLAGFGWGKAEEVYSKEYRAARLEESAAIQMNDYLMIGISAGTPALVCFILYLGITFGRRKREVQHLTPALSPFEAERVVELSTINSQLSTIAASGAIVLLIGFWFDGGLFKLPTAVVFWILLEVARISPLPASGHPLPVKQGEGWSEGKDSSRRESVLASRLVSSLAPPSGDTSSGCATFSPSDAEKGNGAPGVTRPTLALRWLAGIFAIIALGLTMLHLVTPRLMISERTLSIARKFFVPAREKNDFEFLAAKPIWSDQPLRTLLQHVHLANYNRSLVNWKLDDQIYREFVLTPEIGAVQIPSPGLSATLSPSDGERDGVRGNKPLNPQPSTINSQPSTDLNWRRPLWEYFYPRIRKESSLEAAAEIVGRHLAERVSVRSGSPAENSKLKIKNSKWEEAKSIPEIWQRSEADARAFEVLTVAALRSAGIPARLTEQSRAEFWNGTEWKLAPKVLPE